jgi:hypothetical protein
MPNNPRATLSAAGSSTVALSITKGITASNTSLLNVWPPTQKIEGPFIAKYRSYLWQLEQNKRRTARLDARIPSPIRRRKRLGPDQGHGQFRNRNVRLLETAK